MTTCNLVIIKPNTCISLLQVLSFVSLMCSSLVAQVNDDNNNCSSIVLTNLDETTIRNETQWTTYKDIMFPGTDIEGSVALDTSWSNGKVLHCQLTGGDAYNNVFFTSTLYKQLMNIPWNFDSVTKFTYRVSFYVNSHIHNSFYDSSMVEGLEFTFQHALNGNSNLWGVQWSKSNVWSCWNDHKINNKVVGWEKIPQMHAEIVSGKWNRIEIEGHHKEGVLFYDKLKLNEQQYILNTHVPVGKLPLNWKENYLQIGFQINGNKAIYFDHGHGVDPVSVFLDEISLEVE